MLVRELIAKLERENPDMPVAFSKDEEGNWFHREVDVCEQDLSTDEEHPERFVVIYPLNGKDDFS